MNKVENEIGINQNISKHPKVPWYTLHNEFKILCIIYYQPPSTTSPFNIAESSILFACSLTTSLFRVHHFQRKSKCGLGHFVCSFYTHYPSSCSAHLSIQTLAPSSFHILTFLNVFRIRTSFGYKT